jgi:hypothetical protein
MINREAARSFFGQQPDQYLSQALALSGQVFEENKLSTLIQLGTEPANR